MQNKKRDGEIREEVKAEIKRQNRRSLFSPTSLAFVVWVVLVVLAPYVLGWTGLQNSFWGSIEFQGIVSLATIFVVVVDLLTEAVRK